MTTRTTSETTRGRVAGACNPVTRERERDESRGTKERVAFVCHVPAHVCADTFAFASPSLTRIHACLSLTHAHSLSRTHTPPRQPGTRARTHTLADTHTHTQPEYTKAGAVQLYRCVLSLSLSLVSCSRRLRSSRRGIRLGQKLVASLVNERERAVCCETAAAETRREGEREGRKADCEAGQGSREAGRREAGYRYSSSSSSSSDSRRGAAAYKTMVITKHTVNREHTHSLAHKQEPASSSSSSSSHRHQQRPVQGKKKRGRESKQARKTRGEGRKAQEEEGEEAQEPRGGGGSTGEMIGTCDVRAVCAYSSSLSCLSSSSRVYVCLSVCSRFPACSSRSP